MRAPTLIFSLLIAFLSANAARAAQSVLTSGSLHSGGGIVLPSLGSALRTNPAGLSDQTENLRIGLVTTQQDVESTPRWGLQMTPRVSLLTFGGLIIRESDFDRASSYTFRTAASLRIPYTGLQVGVSRYTHSTRSNALRRGFDEARSDFGAIWNFGSRLRVGGTLRDPSTSATKEFAFGAAVDPFDGFVLFVDTAQNRNTEEQAYKGGFKVGNRYSEFTLSYGTGEARSFRKGWSVGGSFELIPRTHVEILALTGGELQKLFVGLTFLF